MACPVRLFLAVVLALGPGAPVAAGDAGVRPGTRMIAGTISEWAVPTPRYPRDPAIGHDGKVYFAVKRGDKIARFDPRSQRFHEWAVPEGSRPQGLVVMPDGKVIFGGTGLGELDPSTGTVRQYRRPAGDGGQAHSLALGTDGTVWFTARSVGKLGKLERASGRITEFAIGDDPYGVAVDSRGHVWVTRKSADRLTRFDPATGQTTDLVLPRGSQPRRITATADGVLWITLYGVGRLAKIDPTTAMVVKEYLLPGGPNGGPYAVNADAAGRVWVFELQTDQVIMLNPASDTIRVFKLPTRDGGVRNAAIDAEGRYWYIGSVSGKLGVID